MLAVGMTVAPPKNGRRSWVLGVLRGEGHAGHFERGLTLTRIYVFLWHSYGLYVNNGQAILCRGTGCVESFRLSRYVPCKQRLRTFRSGLC